jgi:cytochrome c oxidase subunit 2
LNQGFELFPRSASSVSDRVDALHIFLVSISGAMALLVATLVLVFCVRFRRRAGETGSKPLRGLVGLELLWTAIPFLVFLLLFGWGAALYLDERRMPEEGMAVRATAKQWMWKFQHPTGQREIDRLHVPLGTNVILTMISEDVIHSFYVPAFRVKFDVLPGRYTRAWFRATRAGTYHLFCAEYCGTKHSEMIGEVVVLEPAAYQSWLAGEPSGGDPAEVGRTLYQALRCDSCHAEGPTRRGPLLEGIFGSKVQLADGSSAVADEAYLRESILRPNERLTAGYQPIMPTYAGQVSEEDVMSLVAFLVSLHAPEGSGR